MDALPGWLQAGWWGSVAGAALVLGAFVGVRFDVPQRLVAATMAFGSGVLISALAFELMDEAVEVGGLASTAAGFLLDGIPESIVIGLSLLAGQGVSIAVVVAVFLSNLPEGLSSAAGMKRAGHSARHIYLVWAGIALASGVAALFGYTVFHRFPPEVLAATTAVAAGGVLAMVVDTMIPEAFEETHDFAGLIVAAGFLAAFALSKSGG